MTPEEVDKHVDTFELLNAELSASHDRLLDALDKIDGKVVVIVGYVAAAAAFLATRKAQPVLEILAYAAFTAALGFGLWAYMIREYKELDTVALFRYYPTETRARTLATLGASRAKQHRFNQELLRRKAGCWRKCVIALLAGTVFMVAAILVQTYNHEHSGQPAKPARPGATSTARGIPAEPCGIDAGRSRFH